MSPEIARSSVRDFIESWADGIVLAGAAIMVVGMLAVAIGQLPEHQVSEGDFTQLPAAARPDIAPM
jgi:hypothetical protein